VTAGTCRGCHARALLPVFDLGPMPLVNALCATAEQAENAERFPLDVHFCEACSLVQLGHDVPPEALFRDYTYFSSYSDTMLQHVEQLVDELAARRKLGPGQQVIEIASNDGYLLQFYRRKGIAVLGIEPARNVAQVAIEQRQIPTLTEFFGAQLAKTLAAQGTFADVLHAHNTVAHVPDLAGFLAGIAIVLRKGGIACIEVPHVVALVDSTAFDTIYHEHYSYFSLTTLERLFAHHGLLTTRVEKHAIHGGTLRVYVEHQGTGAVPDASVAQLLEEEQLWGVDRVETYRALGERARALRAGLRDLIATARAAGRRVAAYGASAKGCVALNYAGLSGNDVDFVVDRSPHKQGRFMPGVAVPIEAPTKLLEAMPELTLLTVWNLRAEVLEQQKEYQSRGGQFVVGVPRVEIVS
jgi:SAM-dependent methyltransferase